MYTKDEMKIVGLNIVTNYMKAEPMANLIVKLDREYIGELATLVVDVNKNTTVLDSTAYELVGDAYGLEFEQVFKDILDMKKRNDAIMETIVDSKENN